MYVPQALHAFPRPYAGAPQALTADAEVTGLLNWAKASGIELDARRELAGERPRGGIVVATAVAIAQAGLAAERDEARHEHVAADHADRLLRERQFAEELLHHGVVVLHKRGLVAQPRATAEVAAVLRRGVLRRTHSAQDTRRVVEPRKQGVMHAAEPPASRRTFSTPPLIARGSI
jgi:hypothetical protein